MLASPDAAIVRRFGQAATHFPGGAGSGDDVRIVQDDQYRPRSQTSAPLIVFFCTQEASGMTAAPAIGDLIDFKSRRYRVYEMDSDSGGGEPETAGIYLFCTRAEP